MVTPGYNWAMASAMSLKLPGKKKIPWFFPSLAWPATHAPRGPSSLLAPRLAPEFDSPNTGIQPVKKHVLSGDWWLIIWLVYMGISIGISMNNG